MTTPSDNAPDPRPREGDTGCGSEGCCGDNGGCCGCEGGGCGGGQEAGGAGVKLPARVIVSLRAGAVLAIANIVCVVIFSWAWMHVKAEPKVITVTGSAKRAITSDLIVWTCSISSMDAELGKAYDGLRTSNDKVLAYLKAEGINEKEVTISSINTHKRRQKNEKGQETEKIVEYELSQAFTVSSREVAKVADVARKITKLIKDGAMLDSESPRYIYTKLADLKIDMLAQATKDATTRASQIAVNSGAALGSIVDAKMGVLQINPVHSNEVSSLGNNDQSSLEKEITGVVTAKFSLR